MRPASSPSPSPSDATSSHPPAEETRLAPRSRETLETLCRLLVPLPDAPDPAGSALADAVEARVASVDGQRLTELSRALALLGGPVGGLLAFGMPRRLTLLPADAADVRLRRWNGSPIPVVRTAFGAVRRLVLSTWYETDEGRAAAGHRGPSHERAPEVAWEGPLAGAAEDAEPVLRIGDGARLFPPPPPPPISPEAVRAASPADGETIRADVCVVGSGAGGAAAAAVLAEAGLETVVLEEGRLWSFGEMTEREGEMTRRLYAEGGLRATDDLAFSLFQGVSVGGSTTVNWLVMLRTPDRVLEEWAEEHGTAGMRPADLAPVFERIERETRTTTVPDDAHSPANRILLDGARSLGWSAFPARINAEGCVRAGTCGLGCRYGARRAASAVHRPRALAAGARLVAGARAERVEVVGRGGPAPLKRVHATLLDARGRPRGRCTVEAPRVVLAGGAVGTPALLERSGLGGGGVGRFLRLHPTTAVAGLYEREIYQAAGIPLSAVCDEFLDGEDGYGSWMECPPTQPALTAAATPGWGAEHRKRMSRFPRMASLIVLARDGAERGRSSGDVRVDRRGRVRIRYRLASRDAATLRRGMEAAARLHLAAGAEEVWTLHAEPCVVRSPAELAEVARRSLAPNRVALFSAHVNGTCRIGRDPRTSGCTPDGQRHGVPGLYVADGSLLPTAPGVNPQETIMALATVVAGRVLTTLSCGK